MLRLSISPKFLEPSRYPERSFLESGLDRTLGKWVLLSSITTCRRSIVRMMRELLTRNHHEGDIVDLHQMVLGNAQQFQLIERRAGFRKPGLHDMDRELH